jgi:hypothetical protein
VSGKSKVRAGTATDAVLKILSVPRDFPWLTMRDIILLGADRTLELSLNAVASALANLEAHGHVQVRRDRRPYRYRGCP